MSEWLQDFSADSYSDKRWWTFNSGDYRFRLSEENYPTYALALAKFKELREAFLAQPKWRRGLDPNCGVVYYHSLARPLKGDEFESFDILSFDDEAQTFVGKFREPSK